MSRLGLTSKVSFYFKSFFFLIGLSFFQDPAGPLKVISVQFYMNLMQTALSIFQTPLKKQTSLLGDPPKEIRLSTNPYLNLASVLPGICLPGKQTFHGFYCKFPQPQRGKYLFCLPGKSSDHSINPQGNLVVCLKIAK